MSQPLDLELAKLLKKYDDTVAVNNIDLKIKAGSYCCLLGPSGCGKTSTLRMIAGHEVITDGDILLGDTIINDLLPSKTLKNWFIVKPNLQIGQNLMQLFVALKN